jgi:hydrogenase maturation protease
VKVIGCGNVDRGDDAAGVLVARRLRAHGVDARETATLIDAWNAGDDVIVVDAMASGREVGTVVVWEGADVPDECTCRASTHGLGLTEAIRLARVLERMPRRLRVYGIEGRRFAVGSPMSPEVADAIERVAMEIARLCYHAIA